MTQPQQEGWFLLEDFSQDALRSTLTVLILTKSFEATLDSSMQSKVQTQAYDSAQSSCGPPSTPLPTPQKGWVTGSLINSKLFPKARPHPPLLPDFNTEASAPLPQKSTLVNIPPKIPSCSGVEGRMSFFVEHALQMVNISMHLFSDTIDQRERRARKSSDCSNSSNSNGHGNLVSIFGWGSLCKELWDASLYYCYCERAAQDPLNPKFPHDFVLSLLLISLFTAKKWRWVVPQTSIWSPQPTAQQVREVLPCSSEKCEDPL